MTLYPFNPNMSQELQGDGSGITDDRAFIAHYSETASALGANTVLAATARTAAEQVVTAGITDPDVPRNVSIVGSINAAVAATLTSDMTNANADITLTADTAGAAGNDITIVYVDPGDINQALAVSLVGTDITVDLATDGAGAITSTANLIKTALDNDVDIAALIGVTVQGTGLGVVNALAEAPLTGGRDKSAGNVVITGTDEAGAALTETVALNGTTTVNGTKAFAGISSVTLPLTANPAATDTVAVGRANKLGLGHKLTHNTVLCAFLNNSLEGTAPTVATSATVLASNTVLLNSALAAQVVDVYFLV